MAKKLSPKPPAGPTAPAAPAADPPHVAVNTVEISRCPQCGSAERTDYSNKRALALAGTTPAGRPYARIVWRRTRCLACDQVRDDKTFE